VRISFTRMREDFIKVIVLQMKDHGRRGISHGSAS
jgi:hypothetical protein